MSSTDKNCNNCLYWREIPIIGPVDLSKPRDGECRRSPKTPIAIHSPQGIQVVAVSSGCPADYWCGEWRSNEPNNGTNVVNLFDGKIR